MHSTLTLLAAGSLRRAFIPLQAQFSGQTGIALKLVFGPAGLLRERIESGEPCSLFASANRQHPQALCDAGRASGLHLFARNSLMLTVRNTPQTKGKTWRELLADETLRLATSTPLCDPSGDYTWQLFERIASCYPALGNALKQRAMPLVGGRHSLALPNGAMASQWLIDEGVADLFIGYAHYATALENQSNVRCVVIPEPWNIHCEYYLTDVDEHDDARVFRQFILGEEGQRCLRDAGFMSASGE
ncbi:MULTISPECIES: substrate-binding domain-containing protein [unclassified Klebsiella]|uniref:substrate-binding domain-containing protein n=1 Tax=Enterobacteriaceae TaxID=543 RepID=UPI0015DCC945|nr:MULTISPECIES: substrate-binding domain-containing protein [unclassified Klebsiella]HAT3955736.1 solute-binding protein [Kluyvera ascorbata]BBR58683.1 molybdate ABC transporter substrate-binding protein [Klebsiella sp. WP4-W18-ESBL-05]BBS92024.1 molybdate ABC transporter substrate-binding protein [Klebsiella sp. WP7-S18-CRE-02]BBS97046.1 molybdate ABC transporter substrate-binding protein [Klebsiella sp. WP7-S18-CRE-03]BBT02080.1 molybdate ABC transporter substrate-binding protein [Klebsiell